MLSLLSESSLRALLIAAAVALLLRITRTGEPALKHAAWTRVLMMMLVLPFLIAAGARIHVPMLAPASPQFRPAIVEPRPAAAAPAPSGGAIQEAASAPQSAPFDRDTIVLAAYLLGFAYFVLRLAIGTLQVRQLRAGARLQQGRLTHPACSTPVTVGGLRPAVILPPDHAVWPGEQLRAVLAHETEHVRRRDPLIQWLALLNRAVFWFHPLAWWLERELNRLAEESCDAAVLAQGHDPEEYSRHLLAMARSAQLAGTRMKAIGMAMPGPNLTDRVRRMMSRAPVKRISPARMIATLIACFVLAVGIAMIVPETRAQPSPDGAPAFEVASIRPADLNRRTVNSAPKGKSGNPTGSSLFTLQGGRFDYTATVFELILQAHGLRTCALSAKLGQDCPQVSGGPAWIRDDAYALRAKLPAGTPDYTQFDWLQGNATAINTMLAKLLAERFQLKTHSETRELPVYLLRAETSGIKLKPTENRILSLPDGRKIVDHSFGFTFAAGRIDSPDIRWTVRGHSLSSLAEEMAFFMDRPVLDRTGISGEFDFEIKYPRDPDNPGIRTELRGPGLFTAMREQLGLRLEAARASMPVLVIDNIERPSEN